MFRDCYQTHISIRKINFIVIIPDQLLWSDWTTNFWTAGCTSTPSKKEPPHESTENTSAKLIRLKPIKTKKDNTQQKMDEKWKWVEGTGY